MAGKTNAHSDTVLALVATGHYVGLFSTLPTDTTSGTELTGDGYARKAFTGTSPADYAPTGRYIANNAALTFGPASDEWLPVVGFGVFSASTGGAPKYWGTLSSITIVTDAELVLPINTGIILRED